MRLIDYFADIFAYTLLLLEDSANQPSIDQAREELEKLFVQARHKALDKGVDRETFAEAKFAVCAWVDETLLCSNWDSRDEWKKNQLQRLHFNTTNAGVEFFEKLQALGSEQKPLLEIFATCLVLGFRGRYFLDDQAAELQEIKRRTLKYIHEKQLFSAEDTDDRLFPFAYQGKALPKRFKGSFRPFDWYSVLIPIAAVLIMVELYFFYRNDLNLMLLNFFGSLK